jgi:hypothetical protein
MIEQESTGATIIGKLMGFTKRWNPLSTEVFALVEVDARVINVPIDYRQKSIIQKEHPVDSLVPLIFNDGKWEITSQLAASEQRLFKDSSTVFL